MATGLAVWIVAAALAQDGVPVPDAVVAGTAVSEPDVAVVRERGPGTRRIALALTAVGSLVAGTVWFFDGGTWLGAGDPAAVWMGAGFVGATGAALGAAARATSPAGEGALEERVTAPLVRASFGSWGTPVVGETAPPSASLTVSPRVWLGPRLRITPVAAAHAQIGRTIEVESRPQGGIDPGLARSEQGIDASVEARLRLGDGRDRASGWNQLELVARPLISARFERLEYLQIGGQRGLRRTTIVPMALGARWNLSERQRFEVIVGPRVDRVAWSDGAGGGFDAAPRYLGPLHLATRYDVQVPHGRPVFGASARSRVSLVYTNSHFDGDGLDFAAVIGYLGALSAAWDVQLQPAGRSWSLWLGADAMWAVDSRATLTVGYVPPGGNR